VTTEGEDMTRCPFLRPGLPGANGRSDHERRSALYCGLPGGRVRVPDPADVRQFCEPGDVERCPTWQRAIARRRALESFR
jgi:hypothetical protein